MQLRLRQQYQAVQGELRMGERQLSLHGRLDGAGMRLLGGPGVLALQGHIDGDRLLLERTAGLPRRLQRRAGVACPD